MAQRCTKYQVDIFDTILKQSGVSNNPVTGQRNRTCKMTQHESEETWCKKLETLEHERGSWVKNELFWLEPQPWERKWSNKGRKGQGAGNQEFNGTMCRQ